MFKSYFLLLVAILATLAYAQEEPTSTKGIIPTVNIPVPPPGVVCPMSVCPSASPLARREDIPCPTQCAESCKIIDDVCCPGIKKAICSNSSASASPTSPIASPSPVASKSGSGTASPSTTVNESNASVLTAVLSTCVLVALLTVGVYQF